MGERPANRRIREAFEQLEREVAAGRPPADDYDIRIARDGTWFYRGSPIARRAIVKLFASILHRTSDGTHWLVTPGERTCVHVDDTPFVGVELRVHGQARDQALDVRTNLDAWLPLGPTHPLRMRPQARGGEAPYVADADGLETRLERSVFYELAELARPAPAGKGVGVWSRGTWYPLAEDVGESSA